MLAAIIDDLERLIGLGFSPFLALVIVFLLALAGVIGSGFVFFWRQLGKERERQDALLTARDKDREEEKAEVDRRLQDCEDDRGALREDVGALKEQVARLAACPRKGCPMRLPG